MVLSVIDEWLLEYRPQIVCGLIPYRVYYISDEFNIEDICLSPTDECELLEIADDTEGVEIVAFDNYLAVCITLGAYWMKASIICDDIEKILDSVYGDSWRCIA